MKVIKTYAYSLVKNVLCVFCGGLLSVGDASADLGGESESSCSALGEFECECDE